MTPTRLLEIIFAGLIGFHLWRAVGALMRHDGDAALLSLVMAVSMAGILFAPRIFGGRP